MTVMNDVIHDGRVMREAKTLEAEGYNVTVVGIGKMKQEVEEDNVRILLAKENPLWGKILQQRKSVSTLAAKKSEVKKSLTNRILGDIYIYIKGLCLLYINLSGANRILKKIERKKMNVDGVHCHDLNTLSVGVKLKQKGKISKLVYDSHELWTEMSGINPIVKKYYQKKEKRFIKYADKVITVSPSIARILQTRYHLLEKPTLVRNVPEYSVRVKEQKKHDNNDMIIKIIYVGFYLKGRGIEYVLQQIPKVDPCYEFYFRMEGNLQEIEELKRQFIEKEIEDKVKILPFVPQDKLIDEISNYDIGILPYINVSLNNKYCLPNKLFQYIEAGTAILANDLPDVGALLERYNCGLCYETNSERSLSYVLNNEMKDCVKQYKRNAETIARDALNWNIEKSKLLEVWDCK